MEVFDSNLDTKRRQEEIVYYHGLTTEMAAMMCQRFHTFSNITCSIIRKTESDTVSSIFFCGTRKSEQHITIVLND